MQTIIYKKSGSQTHKGMSKKEGYRINLFATTFDRRQVCKNEFLIKKENKEAKDLTLCKASLTR